MLAPRNLPDPDLSLRDASDFIIGSGLARRALEANWIGFALVIRDLIESIHRLVQSCHMPEFTDHGLPHLCSLVDRISRWNCLDGDRLTAKLAPEESAVLLLATLLHDLGMLSQKAEDLPDDARPDESISRWSERSAWVRKTHVRRLPKLAARVFREVNHLELLEDTRFHRAIDIASAHEKWPWEWTGNWQSHSLNRALAAVVAVADLLDEDAARCDTVTLIRHRHGSQLNVAHWLRHSLTDGRILIQNGRISVRMVTPPNCTDGLAPIFGALRNHFRLITLYAEDLRLLDAQVTIKTLDPSTSVPDRVDTNALAEWQSLPGFANESALLFQLLSTFMPEALKDASRLRPETLAKLLPAALEDIDSQCLRRVRGSTEPRANDEETFLSLLGTYL